MVLIASHFDRKRREVSALICEKTKGSFDVVFTVQLFVDELETKFSLSRKHLHAKVQIKLDGNGERVESRTEVRDRRRNAQLEGIVGGQLGIKLCQASATALGIASSSRG